MSERRRLDLRSDNVLPFCMGALTTAIVLLILGLGILAFGHNKSLIANPNPAVSLKTGLTQSVPDYNWGQSPRDNLTTPGPSSVTLSSCPPGVDAKEPWYYVYISGSDTAEAVLVNGGTCRGDNQQGTLQFTTTNSHGPGYTVGSASTGLQEALIASRSFPTVSAPSVGGRHLVTSPAEINIYARVSIRSSSTTIDFSGSLFNCYTNDTCIFVGDPRNSNLVTDVTLIAPKGQPMIASGISPMIEVNGQKTRIFNVTARRNPGQGTFGSYVQVDDDQAFLLDGLDSTSGFGVRCDVSFCGAYVTAPGPFNKWSAVGWLKNLAISNQCSGNGVDWQSGNTLHIEDSVIQGFNQFGVRTGTMRGGYGPTQLTNVYMEVGNCTNPQYPGKGAEARAMAGVISEGGVVTVTGDMYPIGQVPQFSATGTNVEYYWIVVNDSKMGPSVPLPIGFSQTDGKGTVHVAWPRVRGSNIITYDLLKTTGAKNPWLTPTGSGPFAVATRIPQCAGAVCSATDSNTGTKVYQTAMPSYYPKIDFWPGGVVQSPSSDRTIAPNTTSLFLNSTGFGQMSPLVNVSGSTVPTVYANHCPPAMMPSTWVTCLAGDSVGNNAIPTATVIQYGIATGGDPANRKGRIIFGRGPLTSINAGHYITLVDSNPIKTMNTSGYRPVNDPTDTYIGLDNSSVNVTKAQLAFGAPVSISNYIENEGDGKEWKERLTAKQKSFAVPVLIQPGNSLTVGAGSALAQLKMFKTSKVSVSTVSAQHCVDVPAVADGLSAEDQVSSITPPGPLGNLSLNAYALGDSRLMLHFCNSGTTAINVPAGTYSFLGVH